MFSIGILLIAQFAVVALMGYLSPKNRITQRLKSMRAKVSVIACFIGLGQMFYYASFFSWFLSELLSVEREIAIVSTIGLLAMLVLLMLTLFYCVYTNMKQKT